MPFVKTKVFALKDIMSDTKNYVKISDSYYRLRYMQGRNNLHARKQLYHELKNS